MPAPPMVATPPGWTRPYVGLPFVERGRDRDGVDCWGVVRLVLAERFNVEVPSYAEDYADSKDHAHNGALIRSHLGEWLAVALPGDDAGAFLNRVRLAARPGDVALLRIEGDPAHVGIVVAWPWMLHSRRNAIVDHARLDSPAWRDTILGLYRHASLVTKAVP